MAKKFYISADGIANTCKKAYIEIGGIAKKIKKAYIEIGGIAKLFFKSGGDVSVAEATVEPIQWPAYDFASGANNSHAVFTYNGYFTAYNEKLTRTMFTLSPAVVVTPQGGATVNNNIIFHTKDSFVSLDSSLTENRLGYAHRGYDCSYHVGDENEKYAIFGGGANTSNYGVGTTLVNCFDDSLTLVGRTLTLSKATAYYGNTASTSEYVAFNLFDGSFDAFNTLLERTTITGVPGKHGCVGGHVGECLVFAGGGAVENSNYATDRVVFFDDNLVKCSESRLSIARTAGSAVSIDNCILIGGGVDNNGTGNGSNVVDVFDDSFTLVKTLNLKTGRYKPQAEKIGNYALFAAGSSTTQKSGTSDTNWNYGMVATVEAFICE